MKRFTLAGVVAGLLFVTSMAAGKVWYVHPDSSIKKIQAGLDSCRTGDTVRVGPGTYVENLVWPNTQGIDLVSAKGPDSTTIDGSNPSNPDSGSVVLLYNQQDTTTVIYGFTITKGTGTLAPWYYTTLGGGIYCDNVSPSIINNLITANTATWGGGGIGCTSSSPIISNNVIRNNTADTAGGGILAYNFARPNIFDNTISSNTSLYGGGLYILTYSNPVLTHNEIRRNTARQYGGGLGINFWSMSTLQLNNIIGNKTILGGGAGIWCSRNSTPLIMNCTVEYDTAGDQSYGGGIHIGANASPTVKHTSISYNIGTGIHCMSSTANVDSCVISHNSRDGVVCTSSNPILHWCNITDNSDYAVYNASPSIIVDVENNWWGDSTGPYHASNPGGRGDTVSDYVDFIPWSRWPVGIREEEMSHEPRAMSLRILQNPTTVRQGIRLLAISHVPRAKLQIYDIAGKLVKEQRLNDLRGEARISLKDMSAGIYFVRFTGEDLEETHKVVVVR